MRTRGASTYVANSALCVLIMVAACGEQQPMASPGDSSLPPPMFQVVSGGAQEVVPDANTVLLDHFNGMTAGTVYGVLPYEAGLPGLGSAARFGPGVFEIYGIPGWHPGCCGSTPGVEGTIEVWVKFDQHGDFINFNWFNSTTVPGFGHVLYQFGTPSFAGGVFTYTSFNTERCCLAAAMFGITVIPTGHWTHLAASWSPIGSKLYVNGVLDATLPDNVYPQLISPIYVILNAWATSTFEGLLDELHISRVQRSDAEIAAHADRTLEVAIDIKPGSNPGTIKASSKGTSPVAILSTADFDAVAEVDRTSLTFGRTGDEASLAFCGTTPKDVNADGRPDLVCHFTTSLTGFLVGDAEGILRGATTGGTPFEGRDEVRVT